MWPKHPCQPAAAAVGGSRAVIASRMSNPWGHKDAQLQERCQVVAPGLLLMSGTGALVTTAAAYPAEMLPSLQPLPKQQRSHSQPTPAVAPINPKQYPKTSSKIRLASQPPSSYRIAQRACKQSLCCVLVAALTLSPGFSLLTMSAAAFMTAWQLPSLPVLLQVGPPLGLMQELLGDSLTRSRGRGRWHSGSNSLRAATAACFT